MLEFTLWGMDDYDNRGKKIHINPSMVASVLVTDMRRAYGGYNQVAVIKMVNGDKYIVEDGSRTAAALIMEAQKAILDREPHERF